MKKFKLFLKSDTFKIIIFGLILNFFCFFFGTIYANAETSGNLPFTPGMSIMDGYTLTDTEINALQGCLTEMNSGYSLTEDTCVVFKTGEGRWYNWSTYIEVPSYTIYFYPDGINNITFGHLTSFTNFELFDDLSTIQVNFSSGDRYYFACSEIGNLANGAWYGSYEGSLTNVVKGFYGSPTMTTVNNNLFQFTFNANYPVYCNGSFEGIDSNSMRGTYLTSVVIEEPAEPEPTDPNEPDPITPDIPSPVWPDFPSNPTVENLLEYIGDLIKALGTFLVGFGAWLKGALNKIITNIMNGFKSVIDNFKSLFKPFIDKTLEFFNVIKEKFEYITEPIDTTTIYDEISQTAFLSSINTAISSLTNFVAVFNNTSEPSSYTIAIHLENMNGTIFGSNYTTQYIDLSVINSVKTGLRTFLWALITFGLFITIIDSISNYINGGQDE